MHFYPGVAEYAEQGKEPFRVFLNEGTIRAMDPTFAGRPVFVHHVDEVDSSVDELRKDADGWVIESFFNQADGKHWAKFIVVSERGERAIKNGMRLSNCYVPKAYGQGGLWNGVSYTKEITGGEYEHLAIVPNPRYEESVILSPEQFKKYNDDKLVELKRLANTNEEGKKGMNLKLFKRAKVENAVDIENMSVVLPKSGREVMVTDMVAELDAAEVAKKEPRMANAADGVMVAKEKMTVGDLVAKHQAMCDELETYKKKNVDMGGEEAADEGGDADHKKENEDKGGEEAADKGGDADHKKENDEDDGDADDKKKKKENEEDGDKKDDDGKKKNELAEAAAKKAAAKAKADALRNANSRVEEPSKVDFSEDKVARGKSRYGSN